MHGDRGTRSMPGLLCGLILVALLLGACGRKNVVPQVEIARITVEQVKERLDKGETMVFVDSRSADAWVGVAKIPDAVRVPPHDTENHISDVPRGNPVVVYCT
jgi:hypothetical protein